MTEIEDKPAEPAAAGQPAGQDLEVAIARDLLEQAGKPRLPKRLYGRTVAPLSSRTILMSTFSMGSTEWYL